MDSEKEEFNYSKFVEENILGIKNNSFVYNNDKLGKRVLTNLIFHLENCDEFLFSVAFITDDGLAKLKLKLKELQLKNIKGKILTTNYLFFSEPKPLRELLNLPNVELRMYITDSCENKGFHTKGYIFKNKEKYTAIIGSSNLTQKALMKNEEWNIEITGSENAIAIKDILKEFDDVWAKSTKMEEIIDNYEKQYNERKLMAHKSIEEEIRNIVLQPNAMQNAFIVELNKLLDNGGKRGLLISSTGTGKTFASAFALRQIKKFSVKKVLYITHRETILKQAMDTYDSVFGNNIKSSLFTGNSKLNPEANYIFASFSMLIKKEHRELFKPDEFDIIVIDEVHKVGENKYQDIINYFDPKFLLGMSATPDRTDGYDIYKLFDHNIIYEIRLLSALESNMLTPFNYYGIQDITIDGQTICDDDYKLENFNRLTAKERIKNIIEQAKYYGFSGIRLKGLIFVHNVKEGKELSVLFNKNGYRTIFLDGTSSPEAREEAIKRLEQDENNANALDYILTRDIFNEGVDIPSVNQIIMLRPTESSIIFIQQLGRGLRLWKDKEYVTVLDFIGNYTNNFLITKAFSKSKNSKEDIIKPVNDFLPGLSTIQFDEISKEHIYQSIDKAVFNGKREIHDEYFKVKNRLGKIPSLLEFEKHSLKSANVFLDLQIYKSYYDFLVEKEPEFVDRIDKTSANLLSYISENICDGKRKDYIDELSNLISKGKLSFDNQSLDNRKLNIISLFDGSFDQKKSELYSLIKLENNQFKRSSILANALKANTFTLFINQIIETAYYINTKHYNSSNSFVYYKQYSRKDVCKIINHVKNDESTIYGYREYKNLNVMPVFVDYHKVLGKESPINYPDRFLNNEFFMWYSRNNYYVHKGKMKKIIEDYNNNKLNILLFVKKQNSKISKDISNFYFLGNVKIIKYSQDTISGYNRVKFLLKLDKPVKEDIYDYIISPLSIEDR